MKRFALITGSTGGIGLAVAKALGGEGYQIIMNGIDDEQAKAALNELGKLGVKAEYFHFDVTDEKQVLEAFSKIAEGYEKIDVLVNNAGGLGGRSRFEDMDTAFYRKVLALNLDSVFFVTRSAIPLLKRSDYPSIINYTSIAGWNSGGPGAGVYGTAKAAVTTLTRALAKDLVEYGIRVNAVSPGTIDTDFHKATKEKNMELFQSWKDNILMKRFGEPEEVASVVKFLAGKDSSYLTGEIIQINGGQDFL